MSASRVLKTSVMALGLVMISGTVCSDEPSEQEALNAIARELELVRHLVETSIPGTGRLFFDYGALSRELANLEFAVRAHLSLMNNQPRMRWDFTPPAQGSTVEPERRP